MLDIAEMGGRDLERLRFAVRINFVGKRECLFRGLRCVSTCLSEYKGSTGAPCRVFL